MRRAIKQVKYCALKQFENTNISPLPHANGFTQLDPVWKVGATTFGNKKVRYFLHRNFFTTVQYFKNYSSIAKPTTTISPIDLPIIVGELKNLNHTQVLEVITENLNIPAAIIAKPMTPNENYYPPNALNGHHLYNSIEVYNTNLKSGGTMETAKEKMITNLMDENKISSKSVAESIANWLYSQYIDTASVFTILNKKGQRLYDRFSNELEAITEDKQNEKEKEGTDLLMNLRREFYSVWDSTFNIKSMEQLNLDSILSTVDENKLISMTSILNESKTKELLKSFYNEVSNRKTQIPLPIINNTIRPQFLGILDETDREKNSNIFSYKTGKYSVVLAPSGCGKTHEILKFGQSRYCLFFNGTMPSNYIENIQYNSEFGYFDDSISHFVKVFFNFCADYGAKHFTTNFIAEYLTEVLILSRLVYLDILKKRYGSKLTPDKFLLAQIGENSVTAASVFKKLLAANLNHAFVRARVMSLASEYNVFAVLDEANVLCSAQVASIATCYNFSPQRSRPLLTCIGKTLNENIDYVIFAGTTMELSTTLTLASAVGKDAEKTFHFPAKFLNTKLEIDIILKQVINISICESMIEKYGMYLFGSRVRLFMKIVALLPKFTNDTMLSKQEQFEKAALLAIIEIRESIKNILQMHYHSLNSAEKRVVAIVLAEFFVQFTTIGYYEKKTKDVETDMVSLGLCELVSKENVLNASSLPIQYFYSSDRVALEAVAFFLLEEALSSEIITNYPTILKHFDETQSPKGHVLELFFSNMLCLRTFAGKCSVNTEFSNNELSASALVNWIPAHHRSKLCEKQAIQWLRNTSCETFIVKYILTSKDLVTIMQPNTIYIVNNTAIPNIFLYNDEFILTIAFKSATQIVSNVTSYLGKLNEEALQRIGKISSKKFILKISILVNKDSNADSSVECFNNEIQVEIGRRDIASLFPISLQKQVHNLLDVLAGKTTV